jgi:hypothetical protein
MASLVVRGVPPLATDVTITVHSVLDSKLVIINILKAKELPAVSFQPLRDRGQSRHRKYPSRVTAKPSGAVGFESHRQKALRHPKAQCRFRRVLLGTTPKQVLGPSTFEV